jgi:hypothetical protein
MDIDWRCSQRGGSWRLCDGRDGKFSPRGRFQSVLPAFSISQIDLLYLPRYFYALCLGVMMGVVVPIRPTFKSPDPSPTMPCTALRRLAGIRCRGTAFFAPFFAPSRDPWREECQCPRNVLP